MLLLHVLGCAHRLKNVAQLNTQVDKNRQTVPENRVNTINSSQDTEMQKSYGLEIHVPTPYVQCGR